MLALTTSRRVTGGKHPGRAETDTGGMNAAIRLSDYLELAVEGLTYMGPEPVNLTESGTRALVTSRPRPEDLADLTFLAERVAARGGRTAARTLKRIVRLHERNRMPRR